MESFRGLYVGLGLVFGFLFLGIVAELYYLLWSKKKRISTTEVEDDDYNNTRHVKDRNKDKDPFHLIPSSENNQPRNPLENRHGLDLELGCGNEEDEDEDEDEELMRIYNLAGQPRFLFTIKEETKEDLESEDGKSRKGSRNRSLSDIIMAIETPFFTPMASPPLKASPLNSLDSYKLHGFNPLFESSAELELNLNRLRSSPPPKFKFLRDAEEKLYRRLMEEAQKRASQVSSASDLKEKQGHKKPINQKFHYSSASSQVLPLVSSPPESELNPLS